MHGRLVSKLSIAVFMAFAFPIVYPDKTLDWLSGRMGKLYGFRHLICLECGAIAGLLVADLVALSLTSRIDGWEPILAVAILGLFRCIKWVLLELLGLGER